MLLVSHLALLLLAGPDLTPQGPSNAPRFDRVYPLPGLSGVMADQVLYRQGLAASFARSQGRQARVLWVDCTANIDRYNTEEKVRTLIAKVKDAGFNTLVLDIKPISGEVIYKSSLAPKLREWRSFKLAEDYDALEVMCREAKAAGLSFLVSLNAFSEGHRITKTGPGYATPELQSVLYEPLPTLLIGDASFPVWPRVNEPPASAEMLNAYTTSVLLPAPKPGRFAIALTKEGRIVDGYAGGGVPGSTITMPAGGSIVIGEGSGSEFLRQHATPGAYAAIEVKPLFVPTSARPEQQIPLMMNPNDPRVQERARAILKEVATNYPIDGIIYDDRLRYAGLNADFSAASRVSFEKFVGKKLAWPGDIYTYHYTFNWTRGITPGPFFQAWLEWRASTLRDYVRSAREAVKAARPSALFGVYAGSWFGEYANLGSNYGSPENEAGFWYLTDRYRKFGFAGELDFLITGCYYATATIFEAMQRSTSLGATVEYAGYLSSQVARDQTWTYAGLSLSDFKGNPVGLAQALQGACVNTTGVMVFDLSHDIEPMWPLFKQAFRHPRRPPHEDPNLTAELRRRSASLDRAGLRRPPVIIAAGLPGTGQ
ncbi:MAG: family 10 glycosylhydrolase [Armatimonadetes bacterium]|nr:family 10 glycosylhydrolase [Armatimonadota bacterium]